VKVSSRHGTVITTLPIFCPGLDVPVRLDDPVEGIAPVDDRA
jgi:hypothetical protein